MNVLNITDDFDSFTNGTQIKGDDNDNINIIPKLLLLSIPIDIVLVSLIGLLRWSTLKPLFSLYLNDG